MAYRGVTIGRLEVPLIKEFWKIVVSLSLPSFWSCKAMLKSFVVDLRVDIQAGSPEVVLSAVGWGFPIMSNCLYLGVVCPAGLSTS